jgi:hypothetical protein
VTVLPFVVRVAVGIVTRGRAYATACFLVATAGALGGVGVMAGLSEPAAWLIPVGVILVAFVQALPPRPWTQPWTTLLLATPAGATDRLLRWARVYFIVAVSLATLAVPMVLLIVVLWFGVGIRWGW